MFITNDLNGGVCIPLFAYILNKKRKKSRFITQSMQKTPPAVR